MQMIEVEDIHVIHHDTPQIVDITLTDGLVLTVGGECDRCDEWPATVVVVPRLDTEGMEEVDLIRVCRVCIMRLASDDYNAHKELDAVGEGH